MVQNHHSVLRKLGTCSVKTQSIEHFAVSSVEWRRGTNKTRADAPRYVRPETVLGRLDNVITVSSDVRVFDLRRCSTFHDDMIQDVFPPYSSGFCPSSFINTTQWQRQSIKISSLSFKNTLALPSPRCLCSRSRHASRYTTMMNRSSSKDVSVAIGSSLRNRP